MPEAVYICSKLFRGCGFVATQGSWRAIEMTTIFDERPTRPVKLCAKCGKEGRFLSDKDFFFLTTRENREKAQELLNEWRLSLSGEVLIFHFLAQDLDEGKLSDFQKKQIVAFLNKEPN